MYEFLNVFFFVFHTIILIFNITGWAFRKLRIYHLGLIVLTGLSWTVLGIWYGFGYCPSTDWHWQVLEELGRRDLPYSYIKFLIDELTGLSLDADLVNNTTIVVFVIALILSVWLNVRDWKKKAN
jgi:hypothetical protein